MIPGRDELDDGHTEVADTGLDGQRRALQPLGEKEAGRRHEGREVAAAQTGQEGQQQQHPVPGARILHRVNQPTSRINRLRVDRLTTRRVPNMGVRNM